MGGVTNRKGGVQEKRLRSEVVDSDPSLVEVDLSDPGVLRGHLIRRDTRQGEKKGESVLLPLKV